MTQIASGQLWEAHFPESGEKDKSLLLVLSNEEAQGWRGMAYCYCMAGLGAGRAALWTISDAFYRRLA